MPLDSGFLKFCIEGLEKMYLAEDHVFCMSSRYCKGRMINQLDPVLQFKYTMNVLLGLSAVEELGAHSFVDVEREYAILAKRVGGKVCSEENIAITVWTGRMMGARVPSEAYSMLSRVIDNIPDQGGLSSQTITWLMLACLSAGSEYAKRLQRIKEIVAQHYVNRDTSLARHVPSGFRKNLSSFASSCYVSYALLLLGREIADADARSLGVAIARKLVALQGPLGQWGWFYDVAHGCLVDLYPVYSVHQYAMAPLLLGEAIRQGFQEFRQPLKKGLEWVLGQNEMGRNMFEYDRRVIWRSIRRWGRLGKVVRAVRAFSKWHLRHSARLLDASQLGIDFECRSYELGLGLFALAKNYDICGWTSGL